MVYSINLKFQCSEKSIPSYSYLTNNLKGPWTELKLQRHSAFSQSDCEEGKMQSKSCCCFQLPDSNVQQRANCRPQVNGNLEVLNVNAIVLNQNSSNPFKEVTAIDYSIPASVSKAIIIVYDDVGRVLVTVVINDRGDGTLLIYSEKISSGIYSYTVLADDEIIESNKLVCNK